MKNFYKTVRGLHTVILLSFFSMIGLTAHAQENMRANLYVVDALGNTTLMDGNFTNYNNIYSNAVDWDDAWKMSNMGENLGIYRENIDLVIERRSLIGSSDTTTFRMWNMQQRNYRLQVLTQNLCHPGLYAYVKDRYLNTITPVGLNATTSVNFTVTADPGSYNAQRFQLIFTMDGNSTIPVSITSINAARKGSRADISWAVENEVSMQEYVLQSSADGIQFHDLQTIVPHNSQLTGKYSACDANAGTGMNFYRIQATSLGGKIQFSNVAKLPALTDAANISVYPNPVVDKTVQLQTNNIPAGAYGLSVVDNNGRQQNLETITINAVQTIQTVTLPAGMSRGTYYLLITGSGRRFSQKIFVL